MDTVGFEPRTDELAPDWRWERYRRAQITATHGIDIDLCIDHGLRPIPTLSRNSPVRRILGESLCRWLFAILKDRDLYGILAGLCLAEEDPDGTDFGMSELDMGLFQMLFMDSVGRIEDEAWVREHCYLPMLCQGMELYSRLIKPMLYRCLGQKAALFHLIPVVAKDREKPTYDKALARRIVLLGHVAGIRRPTSEQGRALIECALGPLDAWQMRKTPDTVTPADTP